MQVPYLPYGEGIVTKNWIVNNDIDAVDFNGNPVNLTEIRNVFLPGCWVVVGDSPYILIGSAGTELKAKNIYKKGHKSLKTQFLTCIY